MARTPKKIRTVTDSMGSSQDRISALPDEVRAHILSFLPTIADAVRTAALSKRWHTVWQSINNLELDTRDLRTHLELTDTICKSLEKLTLTGTRLEFKEPFPTCCFPALKVLHVKVKYPNKELMNNLFCRCPVLEDLTIDYDLMNNGQFVIFNVRSPTLKRLTINVNYDDFVPGYHHKFVVEATNLEYINIRDDALLKYEMYGMPNVREADVNVGQCIIKDCGEVGKTAAGYSFEILRAITKTKYLKLSERTMALLNFSFDDNILPQFPNLVHLELTFHMSFGWNLLTHFLKKSPVLKVLVVEKVESYQEEEEEEGEGVGEYWIPPRRVPSSLSCVKEIKIMYIKGGEEELKVVKYLLAKAKVLEKMVVRLDSDSDSAGICKQILKFPKGSKSGQIEFL